MDFYHTMPIENISSVQRQRMLFEDSLPEKLNKKNKLYNLKLLIDWDSLEAEISNLVNVKQFGRCRKSIRVMLGVSMLQAMHNGSDAYASENIQENAYWQYFCGYDYFQEHIGVSEATVRRFRQVLGEAGYHIILKELLRVGVKVGAVKKKDLDSVIIDTTVQNKNIKHPHDANLMEKAREEIVKSCKAMGIELNETYQKAFKRSMFKLWKYKKDSDSMARKKLMKRLKVRLGRLIRIMERALELPGITASPKCLEVLFKAKSIFAQSCLNKKESEAYKKENRRIYSFHATEVECIGKGKLANPYEFGNKVGICVSGRGNFVLAAKSFHGNPYDGHTLAQTVSAAEEVIGGEIGDIFVDLGYRGSNYSKKRKIYTPRTRKPKTSRVKKMQKRRNAIEPIIGHMKRYGRMGRNYLRGVVGDILNPLISAIGLNLRLLAKKAAASA